MCLKPTFPSHCLSEWSRRTTQESAHLYPGSSKGVASPGCWQSFQKLGFEPFTANRWSRYSGRDHEFKVEEDGIIKHHVFRAPKAQVTGKGIMYVGSILPTYLPPSGILRRQSKPLGGLFTSQATGPLGRNVKRLD